MRWIYRELSTWLKPFRRIRAVYPDPAMRSKMSRPRGATQVTVRQPPRGLARLSLIDAWRHRELIFIFAWRDLKVRYQQTAIGATWVLIQPLLLMGLFSVIFGRFLEIDVGDVPLPLYYYSALLPWTYFAGALSAATTSLVSHQAIITKVYFPRVLLPVAAVLPGLVDLGISIGLLIVAAFVFGVSPGVELAFLPVFVALAIAAALGVGLWFAALNARYRDVNHGITFLIQLWFFASPIVYPSSVVPEAWRAVWRLNPMVGVIEGFRWAAAGQAPPNATIFASAGLVLVVLFGGLVFFRNQEHLVVDIV